MAIDLMNIKQVDSLVSLTKSNDIIWTKISILKEYMRNSGKSFSAIPILYNYLMYLQKDKFIRLVLPN